MFHFVACVYTFPRSSALLPDLREGEARQEHDPLGAVDGQGERRQGQALFQGQHPSPGATPAEQLNRAAE